MWGVAKTYRPGNVQMCVMVGGVRYKWGVLYVLGVACYLWGGKSGKRKAGRAGIFDFLFLNFFATQISGFSIIAVLAFFASLGTSLLGW